MAKLTDIKIRACKPDPRYFPHVHFGDESCERPRFYRSSSDDLERARGSQLTINEVGPHNHDGMKPFIAVAELFAAAPQLLQALIELQKDGARLSPTARHLVNKLKRQTIPDASETGWGPYFNEDGTPWSAK